jgi:hypothetical protein
MGNVRQGPPEELVKELALACGAGTFVETGTFRGRTAAWASGHFDKVITIEISPELHAAAKERLKEHANIQLLCGESPDCLRRVVPGMDTPAVFWLDAHWSGGDTGGQTDECPLMEELDIIFESSQDHCVLVDDAQFFLSTPPPPHKREQWPTLPRIMDRFRSARPLSVMVIEDVIVAVPVKVEHVLADYCSAVNLAAILERRKKAAAPAHSNGIGQLAQKVKTLLRLG